MYIRNDGKGESDITQNGFTAYLLSAVVHRKADYHASFRSRVWDVPNKHFSGLGGGFPKA